MTNMGNLVSRRSLIGTAVVSAGAAAAAGVARPTRPDIKMVVTGDGLAEIFASRSAAIATSIGGGIQSILTLGYATPGDGGHSTFIKLPSAPSSPDLWHAQTADGAWWAIADSEVSVKALGAVGDYDVTSGTGTDDNAAFQAAARLDRPIYVPGTELAYKVTEQINILLDGSHWRGDGYDSRIVLASANPAGSGALIGVRGDAPTTPSGPPARIVRGVWFSGLHLDTRDGTNDNGFGVSFADGVYADNLYFTAVGRKALTFQYHCKNIHVRDATVYQTGTEPGSTFAAISIEGQTAGIDFSYYPGGTTTTVDLLGADVSDITLENITCRSSGFNYLVISNAHNVHVLGVDFGNAANNGSFIVLTRKVWGCEFARVRGGDSSRRFIEIGDQVSDCTVRDFYFGTTTGSGADGRAIRSAGRRIRFINGRLTHANATTTEAIFIAGVDNSIDALTVDECAADWVINVPPAGERFSLTNSTIQTTGGAAFRIKGVGSRLVGNDFQSPTTGYLGRYESVGHVLSSNVIGGSGAGRIAVTSDAAVTITANIFASGSTVAFDGSSAFASSLLSNLGLSHETPNNATLAGYSLHIDASDRLRVKDAAFTSDTDGVVVGTQT